MCMYTYVGVYSNFCHIFRMYNKHKLHVSYMTYVFCITWTKYMANV